MYPLTSAPPQYDLASACASKFYCDGFEVSSTSLVTAFLHCQHYLAGGPLFAHVLSVFNERSKAVELLTNSTTKFSAFNEQLYIAVKKTLFLFLTPGFIYWYIVSVSVPPTVEIFNHCCSYLDIQLHLH